MFINWSPIRKLIWLKASGAIVPDLPWKTITGNPLSFIARTAHALKSCVVGIEPSQNLNGQANPYPAGGGKNKFDQATLSDYSNYTLPIGNTYHYTDPVILKPNTTYTIKATDTTSVESGTYYVLTVVNGDDPTATSDMTYIYPVYNGTVSSPQANRTFTTGATGAIRFGVRNATYLGYVMAKTWQLEEGSSATDFAPYSNICPISGFTGANVYVESEYDPTADPTVSVTWNTEAGTVYGGTLDVTTGLLTVNMGYQDLGQLNWMYHSSGFFYNSYLPVKSGTINAICSMYPTGSGHGSAYITVNNTVVRIYDSSKGTDPNAFKTAMSGVQFVYELATPQIYQLTAQQVSAIVGENNMWTDCKTLTVEAKAMD